MTEEEPEEESQETVQETTAEENAETQAETAREQLSDLVYHPGWRQIKSFANERVRAAVNRYLNLDYVNDVSAEREGIVCQQEARIWGIVSNLPVILKGEIPTKEEEKEETELPEDPLDL